MGIRSFIKKLGRRKANTYGRTAKPAAKRRASKGTRADGKLILRGGPNWEMRDSDPTEARQTRSHSYD